MWPVPMLLGPCRTVVLIRRRSPYTYIKKIGEIGLILPTKRNSRFLTLHKRPRAGRCQWTKRPRVGRCQWTKRPRAGHCQWTRRSGTILLPRGRFWLCLALYLGCREGEAGPFWFVILLGQVVGAADFSSALSSGGGHMSVAAGFVPLNTAAGVVMGRCLVI